MSPDRELLRAVAAAFDAAAMSLDSCRILLGRLLDASVHIPVEEFDDDAPLGSCPHPDALEVTTLGDLEAVFICPDCGEQFS